MKKRWITLLLPALTLALELLPWGAALNFARAPEQSAACQTRRLYSYFDLTPFGYANFAPLVTAVLTCVLFLLLGIFCCNGKKGVSTAAEKLCWAAAVISLGPLALGLRFMTVVGGLITVSLLAGAIVLHRVNRKLP